LVVVGSGACASPAASTAVDSASARRDSTAQVAFQVKHNLAANGVRIGLLRSDSAQFEDAARAARVSRVFIVFFDSLGDTISVLTAPRGRLDFRSQRLVATASARESVAVLADDGWRLTSEQMDVDVQRNLIASTTPFVFTRGTLRQQGTTFSTDPRLRGMVPTSAKRAKPAPTPKNVAPAAAAAKTP
jgi:hypothetical protein